VTPPTLEDVLSARSRIDGRAANRMMSWSLLIHVTAIVAVVAIPRAWFTKPEVKPLLISVSLGGTPGPQTTGMTPIAGKAAEPPPTPPPRPEPRPAPPKNSDLDALINRVVTQTPKTTVPTRPPSNKPPAPATTPSRGDAKAETPSRTEAPGLSSGGGAGSDRMSFDPNFCCMAYAMTVVSLIDGAWAKSQTERGVVTVKFEIRRDGSVATSIVEQSSGSGLLDRVALSAIEQVKQRIPPLPAEYKENTLVFHLKFPYGG
jgi:protein TonB